jgi:ABC-2 type transport system ATP-binding protein
VINIVNVTKSYHTLVALNEVSLSIPRGEVIGVLGPNGAGKTTLFKLIAGFLRPDSGELQPATGGWPKIGYKAERLLFPNHMRIRSYLEMVAALCNFDRQKAQQAVDESLFRVNLTEVANKKIAECSKGMRQRLGLAQAMIGDPPLLLLDEPSSGLDPEGQADICRHIKTLNATGKTIVLASHQLHEVTEVCTYLVILNAGTIHYQNTMAGALAERPHVVIRTDRDLAILRPMLLSIHPDIEVTDRELFLNNEAISLRRQVLSLLLGAGYDINHVEHSRVTLSEIYAEAVRP